MALFRWSARKPWGGAEIGDRRIVRKILLLPKCLGGEWRWMGMERVVQEHRRWMTVSPSMPRPFQVRGWRDIEWARE